MNMDMNIEKTIDKANIEAINKVLDVRVKEYLNRHEDDKLELLSKDIKTKNGFAYLIVEYRRLNTNIFDLLYFKIVIYDYNVIYESSNVLCYDAETYKPKTTEIVETGFRNYINHINSQLN